MAVTNYENIKAPQGSAKVLPGIKAKAYHIPKRGITAWPTEPLPSATTAAERVTYQGDFTLAEGFSWTYVECVQKKGTLNAETQGEANNPSVLNKFTGLHSGTEEEATDLQQQAINDELVWLVQTMNGKWRVIGHQDFDCTTKVNLNCGGEVTGEKGTTIEAECSDYTLRFYDGEILTTNGDVNA